MEKKLTDNLEELLTTLPPAVYEGVQKVDSLERLIEIVMDLGRLPEARFPDGPVFIGDKPVTHLDMEYSIARVGQFTSDNRAGIERTLHRISCIRNRQGTIIGLTFRVGRAVYGTVDIIKDIVTAGKSILFLGRPGVGKTTKLREVARVLADDSNKRVIVIDTSNEIAGDGDIPHPAIGRSRRMQVPSPALQHQVMIEAVENHTPEVIIVDEIGTEEEAIAARTIAERGVQLIATAHGIVLNNLLLNPTLSDLVGGIQSVTLSDEEARRRGTQKSILERKAPPTFDVAIEIHDRNKLLVHPSVTDAVDQLLRGWEPRTEARSFDQAGQVKVEAVAPQLQKPVGNGERKPYAHPPEKKFYEPAPSAPPKFYDFKEAEKPGEKELRDQTFHLYIYGIPKGPIEKLVSALRLPIEIADSVHGADGIMAVKNYAKRGSKIAKVAETHGIPLFVSKSDEMIHLQRTLSDIMQVETDEFLEEEMALDETRQAINTVLENHHPVELRPQRSYIRRLQHQLVENHEMRSISTGSEPNRRLKIFPR